MTENEEREAPDWAVLSTQSRTDALLQFTERYIEKINPETALLSLRVGTIRQTTLTGYVSHCRTMALFLNQLHVVGKTEWVQRLIPWHLLGRKWSLDLMIEVGRTMTKPPFALLLNMKADFGLPGNPTMRCALLKAQEFADLSCRWAKDEDTLAITTVAEKRAKENNPKPVRVPGAITLSMMEQLCQRVQEDPLLQVFIKVQFLGCFRFTELADLRWEDVGEDGVRFKTHKGKKAMDTNVEPDLKALVEWEGGRLALAELKALKESSGELTGKIFRALKKGALKRISNLIKTTASECKWPKLDFSDHSLRHGGYVYLMETEGIDFDMEKMEEALKHSERMILHYSRPNEQRLLDALGAPTQASLGAFENEEGEFEAIVLKDGCTQLFKAATELNPLQQPYAKKRSTGKKRPVASIEMGTAAMIVSAGVLKERWLDEVARGRLSVTEAIIGQAEEGAKLLSLEN